MNIKTTTLAAAGALLATLSLAPMASAQATDAPATAGAEAHAEDHAAIHAVIHAFEEALKAKDKAAMQHLFYDDEVIWRSTLHPASHQAYETATGQTRPIVRNQGAYEMLDNPGLAAVAFEERFYNPRIFTDGQIASVYFQYDFRFNGAIQNWGDESWQMVKTPEGWKILALLFSANIQALFPAPEVR